MSVTSTKEALKKSEEKYRRLFETMSQCYQENELIRDENGVAVDHRLLNSNPQFERITGLKLEDCIGKPVKELLPEREDFWLELFDRVVRSGKSERCEHEYATLGRWYDVHAFPIEGDRVGVLVEDVTERKQAEHALRENEERQMYLLELSDALRSISDPQEIENIACRMLGEWLKVTSVYYCEILEEEGLIQIDSQYLRVGAIPMPKQLSIKAFDWGATILRRGETVVVTDVRHSKILPAEFVPAMEAIGGRSCLVAPLVKNGIWMGTLSVNHVEPRVWKTLEIAMVNDTLERMWASAQRGRTELALRKSEENQRFLLELTDLLRPMTDSEMILSTAARQIVTYLGASQALYLEVVGKGEEAKVKVLGQHASGVAMFPSEISFPDFAAGFPVALLMAERIFVVEDTAADSRLEPRVQQNWKELGIAAAIATSFGREGQIVAKFGLHNAQPRKWTEAEIRLVEEVAERTWAGLERVRYEQVVKERELNQRIKELEAEQQREVFRVSLNTLEEERHRISESLHNGIGQLLYGIKLAIGELKPEMDYEEFQVASGYASELLTEVIIETRRISHELMPTTLEQFGLKSALNDVCKQLSGEMIFTCYVKGSSNHKEKYLELTIYRTVQELMTNALKHSGATHCKVLVDFLKESVIISVEDNGNGISFNSKHKPGIGLTSIRSNINLMGGTVDVKSEKLKGTAVHITIPLPKLKQYGVIGNNQKG